MCEYYGNEYLMDNDEEMWTPEEYERRTAALTEFDAWIEHFKSELERLKNAPMHSVAEIERSNAELEALNKQDDELFQQFMFKWHFNESEQQFLRELATYNSEQTA